MDKKDSLKNVLEEVVNSYVGFACTSQWRHSKIVIYNSSVENLGLAKKMFEQSSFIRLKKIPVEISLVEKYLHTNGEYIVDLNGCHRLLGRRI